jgi:hypothetical protein
MDLITMASIFKTNLNMGLEPKLVCSTYVERKTDITHELFVKVIYLHIILYKLVT